jgi:kumamolisin
MAQRRQTAHVPDGHQRVERSERQPVPGTTRTGPADPTEVVSVTIRLRRRTGAPPLPGVEMLKQPPGQRAYVSREEFAEQYGADPADVARVEQFARKYGMNVDEVSPARRSVRLSGNVEQMNRAFAVDLGRYESKEVSYRGREGAVHVPADLVDAVEGVFGLDNRRQARPLHRQLSGPAQGVTPLTPPQVANLYGFPSGSAAGQCIGLIEFGGGYHISDIDTFYTGLGKTAPPIAAVGVDGATNSPGVDSNEDTEVALDIDVAGSVAPGASIAVYFAPWTEQGWVDILSTAVHDTTNRPSVLSISWGWPEFQTIDGLAWTQAAMDEVDATLQEALALGVTVLAASGDSGADCGIGDGKAHALFPASDPFITACGGTSIRNVSGSNFDEAVWNGFGATGGGVSDFFPLPAWQSSAGVPVSLNDGKVRRGLPDVAGNADPSSGYNLILGGASTGPIGGTSAVAPLYAGLLALVNAHLGAPAGYLNPALYGLAGPFDFRDVTIGNNGYGTPGYNAGPGWDACTGLGSIHGADLQASLEGQYNWRWCNKCQALCFAGGPSPGPCAAGGNHDHAGSGDYVLVQNIPPGSIGQDNWCWCNKCQTLTFAGSTSLGPCKAGGTHNHTGSGNYVLFQGLAPGQAGQSNWRWCNKCQELAFAGNPSPGPCPAGGNHDHTGSGNYVLTQNLSFGAAGQANWRWCTKCQALSFAGNASPGPCAAGGSHDHTGSGNYVIVQQVAPGPIDQPNWRWCNKCQVLTFAGGPSPGPCKAGGTHDHTGSGYYVLIDNAAAGPREQANWRWCNKCQELAFAGNQSTGACPAGGNHDHTGSGNYVLEFA